MIFLVLTLFFLGGVVSRLVWASTVADAPWVGLGVSGQARFPGMLGNTNLCPQNDEHIGVNMGRSWV